MPKRPNQGPCSVPGCGRPIEVKTWCGKHYRMQRLYGRTELKNTGDKRDHPLYSIWFERKDRGSLCEEWATDFWAFVGAVGDRPSPAHLLRTFRRHEPYGPDNFVWLDGLQREEGEPIKEFHARKNRSRREKHPDFERCRHLIRLFGLSPAQYEEMLKAQGGTCMICESPEIAKTKKTGKVKSLAVDHCHKEKFVRDLLCWRCNVTLGKVKDSVDLLKAMIAYLERWTVPDASRPPPVFANQHEIMLETPWGPLCASDAARRAGLEPTTVLSRLRNGWPADTVLQPLKRPRRKQDPGDVI